MSRLFKRLRQPKQADKRVVQFFDVIAANKVRM